jgi:hypothetical protein
MTVAIALIQVSTSHATAPVIADPGDVIIGDLEGIHGPATGSNIFVFPDAIDLNAIVTDATPDNQIKWSFTTDAGHFASIRINGVGPVAATLLGLDDDDPTSPRAANRIDLNNTDTGQPGDLADGDPFTATFRNVVLSPGVSDENPYFGPAGFITTQTAVVTLFASDCSTFSSLNITVYAAQGSSDSISGGGPQLLATVDFTATTDGWIGGAIGGLGGTVSSGASGLCMTVPAAGNNLVGWFSPEGYVELVANTIYRVRANLTMSAPASPPADTIPLLLFQYDNFFTAGNGNNIGGFAWILDVDGDAQGIGRGNGRNQYDFWLAPNAVATAQWNAGAFTVAADAVNDIRLQFVVNDANVNLLTQNDAGTICLQSIEVASIGHDNLQGTTVYNPLINSATHFAGANNDVGTGTATINNGTNVANIQLGTTGDNRRTVGPFDPLQANLNQQLYPVVWEANTLYRISVGIRAATSVTDPIDAIFMALDVTNNEIGMNSYTTSSGGAVMVHAASPTLTSSTYEGYLFSQNATDSTVPDAGRLRPIPFFFNTNALFGVGGGDAIVVESLEVDKITSGVN